MMKTNVMPIYQRELKSIFYSPVAYMVLFAFFLLAGFFWYIGLVSYGQASMQAAAYAQFRPGDAQNMKLVEMLLAPFYDNVTVTFLLLLPLISMRQFSEEKKMGTIETLFTYPFSDLDIVLGKWMASLTLLLALLMPVLILPAMIADKVALPWGIVLSGMLGLFLVGGSYLAAGLFFSALTENQIVAAALSFGSLLFLFVLGWLEGVSSGWVKDLVSNLTLINHFQGLTKGSISLKDLTYFIFFTVFCLFGTLRVLESKQWR
jgi:ABC-2 type transport system permease protein